MERLCSWPSWISARARSHSRLGPEGHKGHLITNALARPFLHLFIPTRRPRRESQLWLLGSARAVPSEPLSLARQSWPATGGDLGRRPSAARTSRAPKPCFGQFVGRNVLPVHGGLSSSRLCRPRTQA